MTPGDLDLSRRQLLAAAGLAARAATSLAGRRDLEIGSVAPLRLLPEGEGGARNAQRCGRMRGYRVSG
jgi:hypothetical protein